MILLDVPDLKVKLLHIRGKRFAGESERGYHHVVKHCDEKISYAAIQRFLGEEAPNPKLNFVQALSQYFHDYPVDVVAASSGFGELPPLGGRNGKG